MNKGWFWGARGWYYDPSIRDDRDYSQRTIEEIRKSMDAVWEFLTFTTESQNDIQNEYLPTLDFATHVRESGYVTYKFFSKPMNSNILLTIGTALSRGCIFSSLRQDLVRRLSNTDHNLGTGARLNVINDYIQLLVNSGHKFRFSNQLFFKHLQNIHI